MAPLLESRELWFSAVEMLALALSARLPSESRGRAVVADAFAPIFFTPLWVGCNTAFGFGTSVDEDAVDAAGGGG